MDKKTISSKALSLRAAGALYPREDDELEDIFCGSIDRFCDIAVRLQSYPKVLDVGAGQGMLAGLLNMVDPEIRTVC